MATFIETSKHLETRTITMDELKEILMTGGNKPMGYSILDKPSYDIHGEITMLPSKDAWEQYLENYIITLEKKGKDF